jgi:hypothetical protein
VRLAERSAEVSRGHIRRNVLPPKARTVRSGE